MTLPFVVGTGVRLHMVSGGMVRPRGSMIYDPSGRDWPKCSLLIASRGKEVRKATPDEYEGAPKHFLGKNHVIQAARIDYPSKTVSDWEKIGLVKRVDYIRGGTKAPGGFRHSIHKPRGVYRLLHGVLNFVSGGKKPAVLRKRERFYRLDLPDGCIVDDRGIVYP